jgi:hypothetical protein
MFKIKTKDITPAAEANKEATLIANERAEKFYSEILKRIEDRVNEGQWLLIVEIPSNIPLDMLKPYLTRLSEKGYSIESNSFGRWRTSEVVSIKWGP